MFVPGRLARPFACFILCLFLAPRCAFPQTVTSASIAGTVHDPVDGVLPGVAIVAVSEQTGRQQRAVTDAQGRFALLYLPLGEYKLSATLNGFATATMPLSLAVGDALQIAIVLKPALTETVEVEAAPVVETRRTQVSATVSPAEVDVLPINGRNYLDLALLAPNVSRTNLRSTDRFAETSAVPGTGISVSGQRNLGNTFIVDGLSANDDAADLAGTFFSEEVIREFQVVTSGGVAEFGRASSGVLSVVTRSGTNRHSGRVYEFFRDDALDARNPLSTRRDAQTGAPAKDPLRQHQFGVTFGGPIARDRTFWFGNLERTTLDRTGVVTIAPAAVARINDILDSAGYPGPRVGTGDYPTGYHTTNGFVRLDHQLGGTSLQARYSLYRVDSRNARTVGALNDVSRGAALSDRDQNAAFNAVTSLGAHVINEGRAQYTRSRLSAPVNDAIGPAVNINGVASFGTSTSSPTERDLDVVEGVDTLTWLHGTHLLKSGVDVLLDRVTIVFPGALQGLYTFTSLANFERGVYTTFQQAFGIASQFQSSPNLAVFAQDEWHPRADLTVHGGVRYDLQWLPAPIELDVNNVSPRLGIAFAPDSRTVVRAGAGVYFDRLPLRATSNALQRDGTKYKTAVLSFGQAAAPLFPARLAEFPAGVLASITTIDPRIQNGRSEQANVEVERGVTGSLSVSIGYTHLRGHAITMARNINVPTLTAAQAAQLGVPNLGRPNPDFGNISQTDSLGDSWFNGFTASAIARSTPWGRARVSYTWSRALDDAGNAFFQTPQDNANILGDKGPSDNDQPHRLVVSGTVGDGSSHRLQSALAGVRLAYFISYGSALPINPQAGSDLNNDTNTNDRPAGMTRNSVRSPCWADPDLSHVCGTATVDLRISRPFTIHGRHQVEILAEGFNVLNRTNVVNVNNTFGTGATPLPAYKQITAVSDKRQFQLGARWSF